MLVLGVSIVGGSGSCTREQAKDEQEIRDLEDRFAAAFKAKDISTIMNAYTPGAELVVFDVVPPRQYVGFDAYKRIGKLCSLALVQWITSR